MHSRRQPFIEFFVLKSTRLFFHFAPGHRARILAPLLLLLPQLPCAATEAQKLDKIEVLGNYQNSVGNSDAASAGSVTAALIEARPALRPGELLEFVPGVIVTQHSGDGKANQYFLRGFNLDHGTDFATFVDGMPVNMPSHAHGQGYTDLNFLIPELVSRIDYRKGPYYAEEGDFASAGSARMSLFNELKRGFASVTLGENNYRRGVAAASGPLAGGRLLAGADMAGNDGPWQSPEKFRKASALLRYSAGDSNAGYSLTAMAYQARWNSSDQIPQRALTGVARSASGAIDRFGTIDPSDGGDSARYSLSMELRRRNALGRFQLNAYALQSRLQLFSNFTYSLDHPADLGDAVNGDQFEQAERRRTVGIDSSQTFFGKLGDIDMVNKFGVQARQDRLDPVALYSTVTRQEVATTRLDKVRQTSAAIYLDNNLRWTERLRSVAGLRLDRYRFDVDSNIAANSGRADDQIASPKLSLIAGPWMQTEFFLNYGEGFHSNDARGTTARLTPLGRLPTDPVTPLSKSRGSEIGARSEWIPGLQSSLAVWRLRLASELVFVGDAGDTAPSRASLRRGVEWNNHYIAAPWLLLDLDLSLSRARFAEYDAAGEHIPGSIEKVASFGVTLKEIGPWSGSFQWRYLGPRALVEDNSRRSASTSLAYVRAAYQLDRDWKISLDAFNLFNRRASDIDYYYTSRLPGEPVGGVGDIHFHPVEPRSFRLNFTACF